MNAEMIDGLVEAIAIQCGLFASLKRVHFTSGTIGTVVQVCRDPEVTQDAEWLFFQSDSDDELSRLRDELVAFIQQHRRAAA